MKRLLSYMGAYKKKSILGPLFKMLAARFELFVPLVVASMVDVGIANRSVSYVVRMGGLLSVSYTHLDVYKRQLFLLMKMEKQILTMISAYPADSAL